MMLSANRSENRGASVPISFVELQAHFDQPLAQVARKFDVCTTFFKKICRHYGIKRWPFRKLKSLEKKIQGLQTKANSSKPQAQLALTALLEKVHQIRTCTHLDLDDDDDDEEADDSQGNAEFSPVVKTQRPKQTGDDGDSVGGELAVCIKLSSMLQKSLFAQPIPSLDPAVLSRFDSIRGACVFVFDLSPEGRSSLPYISKGGIDIFGLSAIELTKPGGVYQIIGAIHPDDQLPHAHSVSTARDTLGEWNSMFRVSTPRGTYKSCQGRAGLVRLRDGTTRFEGFIYEEGVLDSITHESDLARGVSVFNDVLRVQPEIEFCAQQSVARAALARPATGNHHLMCSHDHVSFGKLSDDLPANSTH